MDSEYKSYEEVLEETYRRNVIKLMVIGVIGFLFSFFLLIDSFLPTTRSDEKVISYISYSTGGGRFPIHRLHCGILTDHGRRPIPYQLSYDLGGNENATVSIYQSPILSLPQYFSYKGNIYSNGRVYFFYKIPLFLLLSLSVFCIIKRRADSSWVYVSAALAVLLLITLISILVDDIYIAPF